ncbi:hypothetical protein BZA77DRAFT_55719 [Pyronema omphalodes]|nr:hypothetical protein BZA77DRAFT_55719 [Pyronema omphalodes]
MSHEAPDYEIQATGPEDAALDSSFQNLNVNDEHEDGEHEAPRTDDEYAVSTLTLRAIVSSKEAGVIIGKAGKNVADLRDATGVKAGVSKVVQGVHDRVLTVTGPLEGVARAYAMVAETLVENPPSTLSTTPGGQHPIRLLISHNQMGTIIGRQGIKIKHIQDLSGARMTAQKEMLPQSTERVVQVEGDPMALRMAIWEIGKCLVDDWARGTGTVLYNPAVRAQGGSTTTPNGGMGYSTGERTERTERNSARSYARTGNGADFSDAQPSFRRSDALAPRTTDRTSPSDAPVGENGEDQQTQHISIPADMVGCIIGRGGTKIQEIRRTSGARISIAKAPHDDSGERMFTITGTGVSNEKALFMLYENLEAEKTRRAQGSSE